MTDEQNSQGHGRLWSPTSLALLGFLAIAAFFLITEHTAHFFGILPFLLLLACPLLHLFMHGRHGGHGGGRGVQPNRPETRGHRHGGDQR